MELHVLDISTSHCGALHVKLECTVQVYMLVVWASLATIQFPSASLFNSSVLLSISTLIFPSAFCTCVVVYVCGGVCVWCVFSL